MKGIRRGLIILFVILNIYGLLCGAIYFFQDSMIFLPTELSRDHTFVLNHPFEEINLSTDDGSYLNGIHFQQEEPKGTILYFHGNAGNLQRWGELMEFFVARGYDVIVMDYRGYGKSTGYRTMEALYSDSELWYDYAKGHYSEDEIIVYGRSLGTAMATYVASRNEPAKLILETPFYSLTDIAKSRFPILPVESLLQYPFPSYSYINDISSPITIYHGDHDEVIDLSYGKKLFDSIDSEEKKFIQVPGGGHNDLVKFKKYVETIDTELEIL
jgi:alpha-beta hydrolase superfamily lysophospholipase